MFAVRGVKYLSFKQAATTKRADDEEDEEERKA